MEISVKNLYEENKKELSLKLAGKRIGFKNVIKDKILYRPGLAFAGYMQGFGAHRIQILGNSEVSFLTTVDKSEIIKNIRKFLNECRIPCFIASYGNEIPDYFLHEANSAGIPVFITPLDTHDLYYRLLDYLDDKFAPREVIHGTLVDVYGVGILLTGRSGIGKSEIALDLVERGHRLVADDAVEIKQEKGSVLMGKPREVLRHYLEIRGLGIIDVVNIFGIRGVRAQKRLEIVVQLEDAKDITKYDRTGLKTKYQDILGIKIPLIKLPIFPGKNITVIAEAIALNYMLKIYGYNPAEELNKRLIEQLDHQVRLKEILKGDME